MSDSTARRILNHLMTERELQNATMDLAKHLGLLAYHTFDSRRSEPGFPDLVIAGPRGVAFIELKRQGGKLTDPQKDWGAMLARSEGRYGARHEYHVFRPHDWHEGAIESVLRGLL